MSPRSALLLLLTAAAVFLPDGFAQDARAPLPDLRALARSRDKHFGANFGGLACVSGRNHAVSPDWQERHALDLRLIARHFTLASAGWQQFPGKTWIDAHTYRLDGNRAFIAWARSHDVEVQFHGLGYIQRGWPNLDHKRQDEARALYDTEGKRAEFRAAYRRYLDAFLEAFGDQVHSWDVINEHLRYGSYASQGYNRFPYLASWGANDREAVYGFDYYLETPRRARELSPKAKLVYLDYNNEIVSPKSNSQYVAAKLLVEQGRLIDAVGFQLHQSNNFNRERDRDNAGVDAAGIRKVTKFHDLSDSQFLDSMRENIQRYADLGLEVMVTELDVAPTGSGDAAARRERQAHVYRKFLEVCLEFPSFTVFKLWGVRDRSDDGRHGAADGYLFDPRGEPKPAAYALADAFATYRPELRWRRDFADDPARAARDLVLTEGARHRAADDGRPGALVLPAGASVTLPLFLENTYNAHLAYRWRRAASPPAGAAVVVEAAGADDVWRELRRHDLAEHALRALEGDVPHAAFLTLEGLDGRTDLRLRFRHKSVEADGEAVPDFEITELRLIADDARH